MTTKLIRYTIFELPPITREELNVLHRCSMPNECPRSLPYSHLSKTQAGAARYSQPTPPAGCGGALQEAEVEHFASVRGVTTTPWVVSPLRLRLFVFPPRGVKRNQHHPEHDCRSLSQACGRRLWLSLSLVSFAPGDHHG